MAVVYRCVGSLTVDVVFFRNPGVFHSQDSFPSTFRPRLWETSSGEVAVDVFAAVARSNTTTVCCKMIKPPLFSRLYRNNSLNDCVANCLKPYCGYVYPRILWPLPHCLMRTNITTRSVAWCILIQLPVAKWYNQLIHVYKHGRRIILSSREISRRINRSPLDSNNFLKLGLEYGTKKVLCKTT